MQKEKEDAERRADKAQEDAERRANEAQKEAQKAIERMQKEKEEAQEKSQKEIAALKQRLQDIEAKVTSGGGSANANIDRFQPKAFQSWPISPERAQASDPLFYDTTYDSEAPTIHMNEPKCRLSVLGAGFSVLWFHLLFRHYRPVFNIIGPFMTYATHFKH